MAHTILVSMGGFEMDAKNKLLLSLMKWGMHTISGAMAITPVFMDLLASELQ